MSIIQKSFQATKETGNLYLVPTPIGHLKDITLRSLEILKEVDYIACEDTRHTRKLMQAYDIQKSLVSYHHHNRHTKVSELIKDLQAGKHIAYVSDAGMPSISDPGFELTREATRQFISVIPLPGANAALTALIGSGLETEHFVFYGFLPRHNKQRRQILEQLSSQRFTLIFYEAPHRLIQAVNAMLAEWGNRQATLCRELTKKHEMYVRGTLEDIIAWTQIEQVRGECCLIVQGMPENEEKRLDQTHPENVWWLKLNLKEHVQYFVDRGMNVKEASKHVARERDLPKKEVYQDFHQK